MKHEWVVYIKSFRLVSIMGLTHVIASDCLKGIKQSCRVSSERFRTVTQGQRSLQLSLIRPLWKSV